jgi:regulator of microtubule dynamics RMD1/3-like protein
VRTNVGLAAALLVLPGWAAGESDPRAALVRYQAALAADAADYEANWRAAGALIDIAKQTPDTVKSPARDAAYAQAEAYARKAVAANEHGAAGHFMLAQAVGRASLSKGNRERIRCALEIRREALRAIELDPGQAGAYHVLGRWNAEIMRLSGFKRFFAERLLGGGAFREATWEEAVKNLEKAVSLAPQVIYHHLELAEVLIDSQYPRDARIELEAVASLPVQDVMDPVYKERASALRGKIDSRTVSRNDP